MYLIIVRIHCPDPVEEQGPCYVLKDVKHYTANKSGHDMSNLYGCNVVHIKRIQHSVLPKDHFNYVTFLSANSTSNILCILTSMKIKRTESGLFWLFLYIWAANKQLENSFCLTYI